MKIFVFSDLHWFHNRNSYLSETCDWLAGQIVEQSPDVVVFCGDMNHTHGYVDVETLEAMSRGVKAVLAACAEKIPFYMISGNHDQASSDGVENVLSVFDHFSNAQCFTTNLGRVELDAYTIGIFCPYPPTTEAGKRNYFSNLTLLVSAAENRGKEVILFTHWEIKGIPYKPGTPPRDGAHAISQDDVQGPAMIVNGHYHHPVIYPGSPPLVIVGSPCYHNYSDSLVKEPRGAAVLRRLLDAPAEEDEAVIGEWCLRRLENPCGPVYHTAEAEDLKDSTAVETFEALGDRLKLRVKIDATEDYTTARSKIVDLHEKVKSLRIVGRAKVEDAAVTTPIPPAFDNTTEVVASYLATANTTLDKDRLLDVARKLVEECLAST